MMQVGVLEWVCGGGLLDTPIARIPQSLRNEGWAMLSSVVNDCLANQLDVEIAIDHASRLMLRSQRPPQR